MRRRSCSRWGECLDYTIPRVALAFGLTKVIIVGWKRANPRVPSDPQPMLNLTLIQGYDASKEVAA
jgi:hypothetical protein